MQGLMRLKRRMTVRAYDNIGRGRRETLDAGEFVMIAGPERDGMVDAVTMAGVIRVAVADLESDHWRDEGKEAGR